MLRDSSLHYRATVSLPSLSSREADRAKIERDVEAFLARGGKINRVGVTATAQAAPFCINPGRNVGIATVRPAKAVRERIWNHEKRRILRERYYTSDKAELAAELGVTPSHLYNEASRLGLTSRRPRKDDGQEPANGR